MSLLLGALLTLYVIVCILLILLVLMQRSKQEGLGAAFGSGVTESMFGAQASNVLTQATVYLAVLFFLLSIGLAAIYSHQNANSGIKSRLQAASAAAAAAAPANVSTNAVSSTPATNAAPQATATPAPAKPADKKK